MCVWNPTTRQMASGSADGMCRLWSMWDVDETKWGLPDAATFNIRTATLPHSSYVGEKFKDVTSVTWSPDGRYLATGCYDGVARIWDNTGSLKMLLREHTGPVFSLKWSKQGGYILSGSYDRRAVVWNADTGAVVQTSLLHSAPVLDVDWRDETTFATCSSDMLIHMTKISPDTTGTSAAYRTFSGHTDEVNAICWSPSGALLASCSDDNTAKIWCPDAGLRHDLRGHQREIYTVRWTPTGRGSANPDLPLLLCTASFDSTVKIWSSVNGQQLHSLRRQSQPVYSISASPDGELLATGCLGGYVAVWRLSTGTLVCESRGSGDSFDVSWSSDGGMLCCCFSSGAMHVLSGEAVRGGQRDP